jgi:3-oxoacyl-[acyl-carrier-protein] synthase I
MAAQPVVVVGVGMMTAVGLSAPETAASVRAATMRFTETPIRDHRFEPFTLAEVLEDGLPELEAGLAVTLGLTSREMRMLRLGTLPLGECLKSMKSNGVRPPLLLSLPETSTTRPLDRGAFLKRFWQQSKGAFDVARSDASHVGRAGGLTAIGRAVELIRSGQASFGVAGGIDTYRDLYVLGALDMERRVKSAVHADGFVPGEGAGFVLLASRAAAASAGVAPLASISPVAQGVEEGYLYSEKPYRGDGLAGAIRRLIQTGAADAPIQEVYSSMNGESHWGKEWGVSFIRNRGAFVPGYGMHHPADCFGDTGAACGPIMVGLAAIAIQSGYRRGPNLVYCSSDRAQRAALTVSAA